MKPGSDIWLKKAHRTLEAARRDLAAEDADFAMNRAYFAAFHAAKAALNEADLTSKSHKGTHLLFFQEYVETGKIDRHQNRAFAILYQRYLAMDFAIGPVFSPEAAADAIQQAKAFVETVAALLSS